jgi:hypothetical protein
VCSIVDIWRNKEYIIKCTDEIWEGSTTITISDSACIGCEKGRMYGHRKRCASSQKQVTQRGLVDVICAESSRRGQRKLMIT